MEKWKNVFIAYDNMCNLDRMKATKNNLPLPPPFDKMWSSVSKIIDSFHLKKHKGDNCKLLYNPEKLKEVHENYNTQACEQTYSWLSCFHRILSSVPRVHNHFFLHRMVKKRNKYNSYCYSQGKKTVLPNVKHSSN